MGNLTECKNKGTCCMRSHGRCLALVDTTFPGNICHFRKLRPYGRNIYDAMRKRENSGR